MQRAGMSLTPEELELKIINALTAVVRGLVETESKRLQMKRNTCTKPSHVFGELLEAEAEVDDCYMSIAASTLAFFGEKIAGKNPERTSKEILEAVRDHCVECAVKAMEMAAVADKSIETINEWSDEE